uniref:Phage protein n=1 Tax=Rhabditophanes sp. KR3021 TaxID=114890 RepID=A0AC35TWU8_9BILA
MAYTLKQKQLGGFIKEFSCCHRSEYSRGCHTFNEHITTTEPFSNLINYKSFPKAKEDAPKKVFALHCKMATTTGGNEIVHIILINPNCKIVMDKLVKPKYRVTYYNTVFTSITKEKLADVDYKLEDLYEDYDRCI